ncbi:GerAB/ArcD/ProY family transporter [Paenibacillus sp. UNC451MF]|uniref:GerAB/ArcD/ProY family transporter n=1 Tax=Paenibacillus sp. UNC451MF TaxID=1449063 RepID=UPI00048EC8BF|nr:GerAB/ArcD/ProY family transporter [Paenibacillus sp. UNC451MF]
MNKYALLTAFFLIHFDLAAFIYPGKIMGSTTSGFWEPTMIGFILEGLLIWLYLKGLFAFTKEDLIDIMKDMTGKWMARILLLPFALYLFLYMTIVMWHHSEMVIITFLPRFPAWSILLLLVIVFYGALKGVHAILRASMLLFMLCMPLIVFSLVASVQNWDYRYALPLINKKIEFLSNGKFYFSMLSFSSFLFLGMIPVHKFPALKKRRYLLWTYIGLLPFYLLSVYSPILIFGQKSAAMLKYPTIAVMDTIEISWLIFDRVTLFYTVAALIGSFLYTSLAAWMFSKLVQKLYLPISNHWITAFLITAVFTTVLFIPNWDWVKQLETFITATILYCMIVIPMAVFLLSKLGKGKRV